MMYVVRKGYSYTDVNNRGRVYRAGEEVLGQIDETQKWKLGELTPEASNVETQTKEAKTKGIKVGSPTNLDDKYYDEMDEGEET